MYYSPSYLIDGSGLSGGLHDNNYQYHMWASDGVHSTATLDFDLGALWILDNALVWNYNWEVMLARGTRGLTILVSSNGVDYNTVGDFTLTRGTGGLIPADVLALEGTPARYVRFSLTSNYGDTGYIGLSEVQFDGSNAVPEPASGLLVLLGLSSGAGWRALRQRVRRQNG